MGVLRVVIPLLGLFDGVLHLSLNVIFNRWFTNLNFTLFPLQCLAQIVLIVAFIASRNAAVRRRLWIDGVWIALELATIGMWLRVGGPNPRGLGYTDKVLEVVLIIALAIHMRMISQPQRPATALASN